MSTPAAPASLDWARDHMPILRSFAAEHGDAEPFDGVSVAVASHLEATTGVLVETLATAGAT
ncbi:MAG: adenosylhomocysteinase, partial [Halobacteriaceae archaeon]